MKNECLFDNAKYCVIRRYIRRNREVITTCITCLHDRHAAVNETINYNIDNPVAGLLAIIRTVGDVLPYFES